ncbi:MAG TPA: pyridoxamine 5'-phosphate oxidase family protein [Nevskiaceae bacterium]|nr:pyridoxamine 5'-phosphate oxidase family protein [Nevskiaceae bacterium]
MADLISSELAELLQGAVSMVVASRDADLRPHIGRALGCRLSKDRREVTLFLVASRCGELLADFRANGHVSMVAVLPSTHRSVQLKGVDARSVALGADDRSRVAAYRERMVVELGAIGHDSAFVRAAFAADPADLVAVRFTPALAYNQTPGPEAGKPLAGAA